MSSSRRRLIRLLFEKVFGKNFTKMKTRKPWGKVTERNAKYGVNKKRRKASGHCEPAVAASSLITSVSRKQCTAQGTSPVMQNDSLDQDIPCDLRVAFLEADGLSSNPKASTCAVQAELANEVVSDPVPEVSNGEASERTLLLRNIEPSAPAFSRPSLLETIFSPVFQLFKGAAGEGSASCMSTVEQVEGPDDGIDSLVSKNTEKNAICPQDMKLLSTSCCATKTTANATVEAAMSMFRAVSAAAFSLSGEHALSSASPEDVHMACQSTANVSDDCIEWMHINSRPLEGTNQAFDHSEQDEILDSDPASMYLSLQQSKAILPGSSGSQEEAGESEYVDEIDSFDPYLFIKHLPDLSEVISTSRPSLLPRQTRRCPPITLVLDLDETLVHSTLEYCEDADFTFPVYFNLQEHTVYVKCRPFLHMFMERVAQLFEIIVFTASQSIYADQLLNILDPKRKLIRHRVFRDSCVFVEGNYLKDLTILGRDLSKVAIIDNSPQAFGFQVDNGIPIESWFDDRSDCALASLLPFLETLVGVDDVRPLIAKKYNLRKKIASALPVSVMPNRDLIERPCAKVC